MAEEEADDPAGILPRIDAALIRMRRLWLRPDTKLQLQRDLGAPVEMSSVLVVHEVAAGPRTGGTDVSVGLVAARLDVDESTASRLVKAAESAGFVDRSTSVVDNRRSALALTTSGRRLLEAAAAYRLAYLRRLLEGWEAQELADFARQLSRFSDAIAAVPLDPELDPRDAAH